MDAIIIVCTTLLYIAQDQTACRLIPLMSNVSFNQVLNLTFEVDCDLMLHRTDVFLYTAGEDKQLYQLLSIDDRPVIHEPLPCNTTSNKQNFTVQIFISNDAHKILQGVVTAKGYNAFQLQTSQMACITVPVRYQLQDEMIGKSNSTYFNHSYVTDPV